MTVAPIVPTRRWYNWIPKSWYIEPWAANAQEGGGDPRNDHRVYRDRDRDRDIDLDDTRSFRRRYDDPGPQSSPKVQVPFGVIVTITIYLVGQLVAGVWWAATLQSNLQHEIADRSKEESRLWQTVETYRLQVEALRVEMARSGVKSGSRQRLNNGTEEGD